jgi:hypothetical protein
VDRISTPIRQGTNLSPEESAAIDNAIMASLEVIEHRTGRERIQFVNDYWMALDCVERRVTKVRS